MSATMRSLVYLAAMARSGPHGRLAVMAVEIAYVTLTAGIYAGMQQRALAFRSRLLGNFVVAVGVPGLAQLLDWLAHRAVGPDAPPKALFAVCVFTLLSALLHLHVMRRGVFLTGNAGRTLADDFRRLPRLVLGFVLRPLALLSAFNGRIAGTAESEGAV
ncbi:MAG: hypothetical protein ACLPH3_00840 [Terracidiphilus sp.]